MGVIRISMPEAEAEVIIVVIVAVGNLGKVLIRKTIVRKIVKRVILMKGEIMDLAIGQEVTEGVTLVVVGGVVPAAEETMLATNTREAHRI